ncbi:MAG: hypothetical protein QW775_01130 [Ignisphaera sp.]|uniref:Uncharacterized protein n=1 Tax=Ignisphaera aggregans TaxID=334771 RepID=A0A7C4JJ52_9CREN
MATGWEPKWVKKKIRMGEGIEVETCLDITTGLIVCPLCVDVSKLCPSASEANAGVLNSGATLFFTAGDLFHHMKAHVKVGEWKVYEIGEEEEEEVKVGEEEIEDEEEV